MFDRFVRLAQAKKALRAGHFEHAVGLVDDPAVRDHRRSEEIRSRAMQGLLRRASRRGEAGSVSAALEDVEFVLQRAPEFDGARTLREELREVERVREGKLTTRRDLVGRARWHAERGELRDAEALLDGLEAHRPEVENVRSLIDGRRRAAARSVDAVERAIRDGDFAAGREALLAARSQEVDREGLAALVDRLARAVGRDLARRIHNLVDAGDAPLAIAEFERERVALPELERVEELRDAIARAMSGAIVELRELLDCGGLEEFRARVRFADRRQRDAISEQLGVDSAEVEEVAGLVRRGEFAVAAESLAILARKSSIQGLARLSDELAERAERSRCAIERARAFAAEGDLVAARAALLELLEECPTHEPARRELELVETGARDWHERLGRAREFARDGRLREAAAFALTLAVQGPQGEEARLLLRDLQLRIDAVQRGIRQVKRDAHSRSSGSREGLRHCVARLDELARMQADAEELDALRAALRAELDGIDALDRAGAALDSDEVDVLATELAEFGKARVNMLADDRLEARFLELVDRAIARVERAVGAGRLTLAKSIVEAVERPVADRSPSQRLVELRQRIEAGVARAESAVECGSQALARRDVAAAESALDDARSAWIDGPGVRRLEAKLMSVRNCERRLRGVEALAASDDPATARKRLESMGPTDQMFRTRIFDIKQGLARAQGLDHAFLLRVDEGGEFLVMRGDVVTIGNVRDGSTDLPILANLAGRHARIRRTMSFHGGMQDSVESDGGEVRVAGEKCDRAKLRDGASVRLGTSFEFGYSIPSKRSLTSMLTLRGFTVAGTDRILLMKDRGRDGRILVGRSADVHVRVPNAECEVEIYATKDGQIRVRCAGGGTIDGRPFSGEEPVAAGALVRCGSVTFVLQPWSK